MPSALDRIAAEREAIRAARNRPQAAGAPAPARAGGNSQVNQSGRYNRDPGSELARLLDLLEEGRRQSQAGIQNINLGVNQEDVALMQQMQQAALAPGLARISSAAGARGITGSSIEGVERGQFAAQTALQGQQFLQDQSFRRAGFELSKNQSLFNSLISSVMPQLGVTGGLAGEARQKSNQPSLLGRLARGAVGAGIGMLTGGPAGAAVGGATGSASAAPDYSNPSYGWGAGANPWDFQDYGYWGTP